MLWKGQTTKISLENIIIRFFQLSEQYLGVRQLYWKLSKTVKKLLDENKFKMYIAVILIDLSEAKLWLL